MNGNGKLLWWIIGTLTTLLLGLGGGTLATVRLHSERIAILETQMLESRHQLDKIEHKLDRILENQSRQTANQR
jgi:hypothetical protein